MRKRDRNILKVYFVGVFLLFAVLILEFAFVKSDVHNQRESTGYALIKDYKYELKDDSSSANGKHSEYTFTITDEITGKNEICFPSFHQYVKIYIDGELVYSLDTDKDNPFVKTPGYCYNTISLKPDDYGKEIKIILTNVYNTADSEEIDIAYGSKETIIIENLKQAFPAFMLALAAVVVGGGFIVYVFVTRKSRYVDHSLFVMGVFSMMLGIWKISDLNILCILFPASPAMSSIPLIALMLVCFPFMMYAKELFRENTKFVWYVPCIVNIVVIYLAIVFQITGVSDFKEMLIFVHCNMIFIVGICLVMMIREMIKFGLSKKLKITIVCLSLCLAGLLCDIFVYYVTDGTRNTIFGMTAFFLYVVVLGAISIKDVRRLIEKGNKATEYEEMAYTDQLTGLYNRTAYAYETMRGDFELDEKILVMFDMNNLKGCNDNYGHDLGDEYIRTCAKIISDAFSDAGKCFRTGGDEFIALLSGITDEECGIRGEKMEKEIEKVNKEKRFPFEAGIAYGFADCDANEDDSITNAMRRADKKMYEKKIIMKQHKV